MKAGIIAEREQWNNFLMSQPEGHLLQSYQWGELIEQQGGRIYRLGVLENEQLIGAMMLLVADIPLPVRLPGRRPCWLYCSRGPVVMSPQSPALKALVEEAHKIAKEEHAVVLRLEPNITEDDPKSDEWLKTYSTLGFQTNPMAIHGRRSWTLDLRPDMDTIFSNFRKRYCQYIRVAERKGVIVRAAESDADFDAYYELLQSTSKRDGFFIHNKAHHKEMFRLYDQSGDVVLLLAELEGELIAAKMLIRFGSWCYEMFGATSDKDHGFPKAHLVQYRCLQWAKEKGCEYYDFRIIPEILEPGEEMWGIYQFKKGFGGFSRLHLPTQDYVYQLPVYALWRWSAQTRRNLRRARLKKKYAREKSHT
jgi:peptidoglycan pentaglycine glycine transferase (the first glycine)